MPPVVNPGSLDEYAWAIPGMLRRTASLASGEGGVPRVARHGADGISLTPEALARTGAFAFRALQAEFAEAAKAHPDELEIFTRTIGGLHVGFEVVGREIARQLTHSLGHLPVGRVAPDAADLTIAVWDEEATGLHSAVRPTNEDLSHYGMILYSPDARFISYQRPDAASWLDRSRRHVVAWYRSAERVYLDQLAKPFNKLLFDPLRDRDVAMAHAGLVARDGVGALIPGRSGAGKSTSSLACLAAGFDFIGDDYVGVQELEDGSFLGHSLFASAVLDPNHLTRFPVFVPDAQQTFHEHETKSFLPLVRRHGPQLKVSTPIGLILVPRIVDAATTTLRPASKFAALLAVAPPSLLSMPRPRRETFEMFVRLIERTPACWLELGRDIATIPRAVATALEREALR